VDLHWLKGVGSEVSRYEGGSTDEEVACQPKKVYSHILLKYLLNILK